VAPFDAVYPRLAGVDHPTDWLLLRQGGRELLAAAARLAPLAPTFVAKGAEAGRRRAGPRLGRRGGRAVHAKGEPRAFGKSRPAEVTAAQDEVQAIVAACRQHEARPTTSAWRA
jgi:ATP-dependent helicase/nuclease subunit A